MKEKHISLAGIIRGTLAATSVAVGGVAGAYTGHKVYEYTGDVVTSSVAGSMTGCAVAAIGTTMALNGHIIQKTEEEVI